MSDIVLIIGAGASKALNSEFGLGKDLLQEISDRVRDRTSPDTPNLSNLYKKLHFHDSILERFERCLDEYKSNQNTQSIDEFLNEVDSYPEFQKDKDDFIQIGKFAICFQILGYEGALKRAGGPNDNAWINIVARFIDERIKYPNQELHNFKIITFNYDRNIEHYLHENELFKNKKQQIRTFINNNIIHLYGKIGNLPWQHSEPIFEFGEDNDKAEKIFRNKNIIKVMYAERSRNQREAEEKAKGWIHSVHTKKVCAFGFNFDLINYRLLSLQNLGIIQTRDLGVLNTYARLIANVYPQGLTFNERRAMASRIRNIKHDAEITYKDCSEFVSFVLYGKAKSGS